MRELGIPQVAVKPTLNLGLSHHHTRYHSLSMRRKEADKKQSCEMEQECLKLPELQLRTDREPRPEESDSSDRLPLTPSLARLKFGKELTSY